MSRYINHLVDKLDFTKLEACSVCNKSHTSPAIISCGHIVCQPCGARLTLCPMCRQKLRPHTITVSPLNVIELYQVYFPDAKTYDYQPQMEALVKSLKSTAYDSRSVLFSHVTANYFRTFTEVTSPGLHMTFITQMTDLLWYGDTPEPIRADASTQTTAEVLRETLTIATEKDADFGQLIMESYAMAIDAPAAANVAEVAEAVETKRKRRKL